ncbi:MAG: beta-propeller fold lactonase family protein, partial [Terriglobales bacterium]
MKTIVAVLCFLLSSCLAVIAQDKKEIPLPTSKILLSPAPGKPQRTNSFPATMALSPDGNYLVLLNDGYGTAESAGQQSLAVLDLKTGSLTDFPDPRLGRKSHQTSFGGLAFSGDGKHLYASFASITDPRGEGEDSTGNGIAVYHFEQGRPLPERFIPIPLQPLAAGKHSENLWEKLPDGKAIPFPAGIAVISGAAAEERLLVADNLSDDALLLDATTGKTLHRFDLSLSKHIPATYPYTVVADHAGKRAWVTLWNASRVAELDLASGKVVRMIALLAPKPNTQAGSHPTAILLSSDEATLYVALANADRVAAVHTGTGRIVRYISTRLPGQKFAGSYPNALALGDDGNTLYVANASGDNVAVIDLKHGGKVRGFIPTEFYPTALALNKGELFVASAKGQGTGPNSTALKPGEDPRTSHAYIATLLHGSLARIKIEELETKLPALTEEVMHSNLMNGRTDTIAFAGRKNPIRHVIYVIKENRTYDQILGDLKAGDGDPSLVLYGEDITPNQHKLALQFGILDNFYDSGEVSGDGHVWSTAAITSDYTERTWQINYRNEERTYDYEGQVANGTPLNEDIADVNEPGSGYLWTNLARHHRSYRHYGEFVASTWCNEKPAPVQSPQLGTPLAAGPACPRTFVNPEEPLADGTPSPFHWPVAILATNIPTKPELRGHFDPLFGDFNLQYPDQLRADEFLREFAGFVRDGNLPEFITLRLGNDHTAGTRAGHPTPAAAVADNDLAVGRVVEAVSHSRYWDSTAIFVLEDDAQNGADHVDAHRSIALAISKYAPVRPQQPLVDHHFYTTVNMIHTMETLLGLPPMNNNDAQAAVMAPLFTGPGTQPPFRADIRNRESGLIYEANQPKAPGAAASAKMDFSHADAADSSQLNQILWQDRKGAEPMPAPVHLV